MEIDRQTGGYEMSRANGEIKTVPNQRVISINKEPTDKQHLYTANNLIALDEAATRLQSIGGFKLYIYLAKNQNNYTFALSSKDFMQWSGLGKQAYTSAFEDLVRQGYLIQDKKQKNKYTFYDKSQQQEYQKEQIDDVVIDYTKSSGYKGFIF